MWKPSSLYGPLCAFAMAAFPVRAVVDIPANDPGIQYFGRWDLSNPLKPGADWPGTWVRAVFKGTTATIKLSGGQNDYNVVLDGKVTAHIVTDGPATQVVAQGLADSAHTLILYKRTEGFNGIATFQGLQLADGKSLATPPARPAHKIQFIGDSFTVGFGADPTSTCTDRRPYDDNYLSWDALSARALDADYSVQAISGIGMIHNVNDQNPQSAMPSPAYFDRVLFNSATPKWDSTKWIPELIVIALGTNDFSGSVKPSQAQYVGAYEDFLKRLRGLYANANIVCLSYAVDSYQPKYVDTVVKDMNAKGDAKVHAFHEPVLNGSTEMGCFGHPNTAGHQKYADNFIPFARQFLPATGIRPMLSGRTGRPSQGGILPGTETWTLPFGGNGSRARADGRSFPSSAPPGP